MIQPLIKPEELVYEGTIRTPMLYGANMLDSLAYGGLGLSYFNDSFFLFGHPYGMKLIQITRPPAIKSTRISDLNTAVVIQPLTDVFNGKWIQVTEFPTKDTIVPGSSLVHNGQLILSCYIFYDGVGSQSKSHFIRSLDFTNRDVDGPLQLGPNEHSAGTISGYMCPIPFEWQAKLGGKILVGNACIPIISRSSFGPSCAVTDPDDFSQLTQLLYYDKAHDIQGSGYDTTKVTGVVFIPGTSTVIFVGNTGTGPYTYGIGTNDPKDASYDPVNSGKGPHAYPYKSKFWYYDANDFVRVKNGELKPYDVKPYAESYPVFPWMGGMNDLYGATFDSLRNKLYISQPGQDRDSYSGYPLIHEFSIKPSVPLVPPVIVTQPTAKGITFSKLYSVTSTGGMNYRWQYSTDGITYTDLTNRDINGVRYSGVQSSNMMITVIDAALLNNLTYRCRITNQAGSILSDVVPLNVVR